GGRGVGGGGGHFDPGPGVARRAWASRVGARRDRAAHRRRLLCGGCDRGGSRQPVVACPRVTPAVDMAVAHPGRRRQRDGVSRKPWKRGRRTGADPSSGAWLGGLTATTRYRR